MENKRFYVTISRQFGSGGAEIASKVATKLGVRCYDKSISEMTSVVTGFDKNIVVSSEEQTANTFWYSGFLGGDSLNLYDKVYIGQSKVIKNLAEKGSCVFVGRCASRILKDYENECWRTLGLDYLVSNEPNPLDIVNAKYERKIIKEKWIDLDCLIDYELTTYEKKIDRKKAYELRKKAQHIWRELQ